MFLRTAPVSGFQEMFVRKAAVCRGIAGMERSKEARVAPSVAGNGWKYRRSMLSPQPQFW